MKTCPDCGSPVYALGCTWCNEDAYIEQQAYFDSLPDAYAGSEVVGPPFVHPDSEVKQ